MKSFERTALVAAVLAPALILPAVADGIDNNAEHRTVAANAEPVCSGVTIKRIDFETFKILPILSGQFSNPDQVRSSISLETDERSGPVGDTQSGVGYTVGLNAASRNPVELKLDYHTQAAANAASYELAPRNAEVTCPPTDLGALVVKYFQTHPGSPGS